MKFISYILRCVLQALDALVGIRGDFKETLIGALSIGVAGVIFLVILFFLNNKTKFSYKFNFLLAILLTVLAAVLILIISILVFTTCILNWLSCWAVCVSELLTVRMC